MRMANPPKQKGTGYETEVVNSAATYARSARRTAPTMNHDVVIEASGLTVRDVIPALFTRPDRGRTLVTIEERDFYAMLPRDFEVQVECKRYARFSLHAIFDKKFGRP